jgi:hypothetical protein
MAGDVVDRDATFENTQVHYNADQKWYYLPNQLPQELLIFKNADSEAMFGAAPGKFRERDGEDQSRSALIKTCRCTSRVI